MTVQEKLFKLNREEVTYAADLAFLLGQCPWITDPTDEFHGIFSDISKRYNKLRSLVPEYISDSELREIALRYRE